MSLRDGAGELSSLSAGDCRPDDGRLGDGRPDDGRLGDGRLGDGRPDNGRPDVSALSKLSSASLHQAFHRRLLPPAVSLSRSLEVEPVDSRRYDLARATSGTEQRFRYCWVSADCLAGGRVHHASACVTPRPSDDLLTSLRRSLTVDVGGGVDWTD